MGKYLNSSLFRVAAFALASAGAATQAAEITYVTGAPVGDRELLARIAEPWEKETGHTLRITPMPPSTTDSFGQYRLWLAAQNSEIDIYETDVVWAPQLADHFVDLTEAAAAVAGDHFPSIIESQTVNGALVALPLFTDAPALYFRRDLIEKHGASVPTKWEDLTATAAAIQAAERDEGNSDFWGFVWQGNAYEGLTCDGLEWVKSFGGGQIVEADGTISINNPEAAAAITLAASWIGTISPEGTLSYQEEDSAASGNRETRCSCATGRTPIRWATPTIRRSRASSESCRCLQAATMTVPRPRSAAGIWRSRAIPRMSMPRHRWRCI